MARTLYPQQTTAMNYSASTWSLSDGGVADLSKPVAGDTILLTANSGAVTCDEPWAAANLSGSGGTWYFTAQPGTVTGEIDLANIAAIANGASLIVGGDFVVGAAGTFGLLDDTSINCDTFELVGTIDTGGNTLTVNGDVLYTAGVVTELNLTMTGSANTLGWARSGELIDLLTLASGATITTSAVCWMLAIGGTGALVANHTVTLHTPTTDFWLLATQVTGNGTISFRNWSDPTTNTSDMDIDCRGGLDIRYDVDGVLTLAGAIDINARPLAVRGTAIGGSATLTLTGPLTCGTATLGNGANTGSGILNLGSGNHSIVGIVMGNATNGANALDFGTSSIRLSGTIDGDNITFTNTSGVVVLGTIHDVDLTGETPLLHIIPDTAGVDNVNVTDIDGVGGDPEVYVTVQEKI